MTAQDARVAVVFRTVRYPVAFDETGLPAGTNWSVSLGGSLTFSNTSTVLCSEPERDLPVHRRDGRRLDPRPSERVRHRQRDSPLRAHRLDTQLPRHLRRHGLGERAPRRDDVVGQRHPRTLDRLAGRPPHLRGGPGTYAASVATSDKSYESQRLAFEVRDANLSEQVDFLAVTYPMTFVETGLPSGTVWSVSFDGTTDSRIGNQTFLGIPNGSYRFDVVPFPDWSADPSNGVIVVDGPPHPETVAFEPIPAGPSSYSGDHNASTSPATFLGLPASEGYELLAGIVVAIVAVVLGVVAHRRRRARNGTAGDGESVGGERSSGFAEVTFGPGTWH